MNDEGKEILGFEKYVITVLGKVINTATGRVLKTRITYNGYDSVVLCKHGRPKSLFIHKILAIAFIPNPGNKPCINHKNSIRSDNHLENLEWCTQQENIIHGYKFGSIKAPRGENQGSSKLKTDDVIVIKNSTKTQEELSALYNVSQTTISNIIKRRSWTHI